MHNYAKTENWVRARSHLISKYNGVKHNVGKEMKCRPLQKKVPSKKDLHPSYLSPDAEYTLWNIFLNSLP